MLIKYFQEVWEEAKREGYAFIFETCDLQRGDRLNRDLADEDLDDNSLKVGGPFEQDSLYITYDDFHRTNEAYKVESPEELGSFLEGVGNPRIADAYVIVTKKNGSIESYTKPLSDDTAEEAVRKLEEAWSVLSSEDKHNTVLELACVAVDDNGVMDNYNDYFYDFAAYEYETIHSYTPIAVISLATGEKIEMNPEM